MPPRRNEEARVIGPTWIPSRQRWRVLVKRPGENKEDDRNRSRYFVDGDEAEAYANGIAAQLARFTNTTVGEAIGLYEAAMKKQGTLEVSRRETIRRLTLFFTDHKLSIGRVTPQRAQAYYDSFQIGRSVDYHRNTLAESKTFMRWCIKQGWISSSPIEDIEGVGRRNSGKPQLTGNEAHKLYEWCLWKANRGDEAALAVLLTLLLALRQKDVRARLIRDVDLDATMLRISDGKTKKSNRPRKVPAVLQPLLRRFIEDRSPLEPLFKSDDGGFHTKTWLRAAMKRFCRAAGVPYVCPHALKGTVGTLLADDGVSVDRIAEYLSHEHVSTSERHYIAPGAVAAAQAERAFAVIAGGKK